VKSFRGARFNPQCGYTVQTTPKHTHADCLGNDKMVLTLQWNAEAQKRKPSRPMVCAGLCWAQAASQHCNFSSARGGENHHVSAKPRQCSPRSEIDTVEALTLGTGRYIHRWQQHRTRSISFNWPEGAGSVELLQVNCFERFFPPLVSGCHSCAARIAFLMSRPDASSRDGRDASRSGGLTSRRVPDSRLFSNSLLSNQRFHRDTYL